MGRVRARAGLAVRRQLGRLAEADLVTVTHTGNQKHYQARRDSPIFEELHGLVVKTIGMAGPLRQALERQAQAIRADSFAARVAGQPRVFVIGSDDDLA